MATAASSWDEILDRIPRAHPLACDALSVDESIAYSSLLLASCARDVSYMMGNPTQVETAISDVREAAEYTFEMDGQAGTAYNLWPKLQRLAQAVVAAAEEEAQRRSDEARDSQTGAQARAHRN